MKITTLIENTSYEGAKGGKLKPEHGISLVLESQAHKILFDTGASRLFLENAKALDLTLDDVDFAVISHGHFDHGGGLKAFLEENSNAPVYLKESAFEGHYVKRVFFKKNIGLDTSLLQNYRGRFVCVKDITEVGNGIYLIPKIVGEHPKPLGNKNLVKKSNGSYLPDDFEHELLLVVQEADGLVIFTGCSHSGIVNMIETVETRFHGEPIKAVVGGFHLISPSRKKMSEKKEEVLRIGGLLNAKDHVMKVFTGHCTGKMAYKLLKSQMGEKLEYFATGQILAL